MRGIYTLSCCYRLIFSSIFCLAILQSSARVFTVVNTNDDDKANRERFAGSLRSAVMAANQLGGKNTIILSRAMPAVGQNQSRALVFHLTKSGANEDAGKSGDLDIRRGDVTIIGAVPNVVIDATGLGDRVFQVFTNAKLTLQNVTITGGRAPQAEFGSFYFPTRSAQAGGGIWSAGTVFLKNCIVTNNASGDGNGNYGNGGRDAADGGGIFNLGLLVINHCQVVHNFAGGGFRASSGGNGGGIVNFGFCFITHSTVSANASGFGGDHDTLGFLGSCGDGGGIVNAGSMVMKNCRVSDNVCASGLDGGSFQTGSVAFPGLDGSSGGNGAGIDNSGNLTVNSTIITGNRCGDGGNGGRGTISGGDGGKGGDGGGIFNSGSAVVLDSKITNNSCGDGGNGGGVIGFWEGENITGGNGGNGGSGGGILSKTPASLEINNTLVELNQFGAGGTDGSVLTGQTPGNAGLDGEWPNVGEN